MTAIDVERAVDMAKVLGRKRGGMAAVPRSGTPMKIGRPGHIQFAGLAVRWRQ
jgi:hypothetical protein